jgi:hypothetical protein
MHERQTPAPDNGTRTTSRRGGLAKEQGGIISECAVAGGYSVWRHDAVVQSQQPSCK